MREYLRLKFKIPELREALLETGNAELTEGNTWHDNFWGVYVIALNVEHLRMEKMF